jgi:hypothetical protein
LFRAVISALTRFLTASRNAPSISGFGLLTNRGWTDIFSARAAASYSLKALPARLDLPRREFQPAITSGLSL